MARAPSAVLHGGMAVDDVLLESGRVGDAGHQTVDRRHVQRLVDKDVVLTGVNPTLVPREAPAKRAKREERSA